MPQADNFSFSQRGLFAKELLGDIAEALAANLDLLERGGCEAQTEGLAGLALIGSEADRRNDTDVVLQAGIKHGIGIGILR